MMRAETLSYPGPERRRYFRVDDKIALSTRVISPEDLSRALGRYERQRDELRLLNLLGQHQARHRGDLDGIARNYPEIAEYMRLLQAQIELLASLVATDPTVPEGPTHDVSLSPQGIRFYSPEPLEPDSLLELRLRLFPSRQRLMLYGRVVACDEAAEEAAGGYTVAVEFRHIQDSDREALARHVDGQRLHCLGRRPQGGWPLS